MGVKRESLQTMMTVFSSKTFSADNFVANFIERGRKTDMVVAYMTP